MASGFLVLISYFTRIPVGKKIEYNEDNFKEALVIYTLIGAVIGLFLAFLRVLGNSMPIIFVRGLVLTIGYVLITGGIHLDGAADTTDGLFSGRTGERIFEIMSDSHIGAFGVLSLIIIVLSQFVLFSYADVFLCFMMPVVGRTSLIVASWNRQYPKKSKGMGTVFVESINNRVLIINLIILAVFSIMMPHKFIFLTSSFSTLVVAYFVSCWIEDKIGGMTGDTCGFVIELSQITFMILVLFLKG